MSSVYFWDNSITGRTAHFVPGAPGQKLQKWLQVKICHHGMRVELKIQLPLQKDSNTYVQLHQQKSDLKRSRRRWSSKVGPTGKRPHHQANPQFLMRPHRRPSPIGHDEANSCLFLLKIHLSLQKGANYKHICSASPTKKWAGNVRIGVLRCSRRGLLAKVVILATQKICLATAYVRGCFLSIVWGVAPRNLFDIRGE